MKQVIVKINGTEGYLPEEELKEFSKENPDVEVVVSIDGQEGYILYNKLDEFKNNHPSMKIGYNNNGKEEFTPISENTVENKEDSLSIDKDLLTRSALLGTGAATLGAGKKAIEISIPYLGELNKRELDVIKSDPKAYKNTRKIKDIAKSYVDVVEQIEDKGRKFVKKAEDLLLENKIIFNKNTTIKDNINKALVDKKAYVLDANKNPILTETFKKQFDPIKKMLEVYPAKMNPNQVTQFMEELRSIAANENNELAKSIRDHISNDIGDKVPEYKKLYKQANETFIDKEPIIKYFGLKEAQTSSGVYTKKYIPTEVTQGAIGDFIDIKKINEPEIERISNIMNKYGESSLLKETNIASIKNTVSNAIKPRSAFVEGQLMPSSPTSKAIKGAISTVKSVGTKGQEISARIAGSGFGKLMSKIYNLGGSKEVKSYDDLMKVIAPASIQEIPKISPKVIDDLSELYMNNKELKNYKEALKNISPETAADDLLEIQKYRIGLEELELESRSVGNSKASEKLKPQIAELLEQENKIKNIFKLEDSPEIETKKIKLDNRRFELDGKYKVKQDIELGKKVENQQKLISKVNEESIADQSNQDYQRLKEANSAQIENDISHLKTKASQQGFILEPSRKVQTELDALMEKLPLKEKPYYQETKFEQNSQSTPKEEDVEIKKEPSKPDVQTTATEVKDIPEEVKAIENKIESKVNKPSKKSKKQQFADLEQDTDKLYNQLDEISPKVTQGTASATEKSLFEELGKKITENEGLMKALKKGIKGAAFALPFASSVMTIDEALAGGHDPLTAGVLGAVDVVNPIPMSTVEGYEMATDPKAILDIAQEKEPEIPEKAINMSKEAAFRKYLDSQAAKDTKKQSNKIEAYQDLMNKKIEVAPEKSIYEGSEGNIEQFVGEAGVPSEFDEVKNKVQADVNYLNSPAKKDAAKFEQYKKYIDNRTQKNIEPEVEFKTNYEKSDATKDKQKWLELRKKKDTDDIDKQNLDILGKKEESRVMENPELDQNLVSNDKLTRVQANFAISPAAKKRLGVV